MGWIAYTAAWLSACLVWTLASAASSGRSPFDTLPYALLAMAFGAGLGVAVWHLTGAVRWGWSAPRFYAVHAASLLIYAVLYSTSWMWPDLIGGRAAIAVVQLRHSPVLIWNLLMGSWLYLVVAGISYAVRAQRKVRMQEADAAEARLLAQQAQLTALRAQVNPHFLFNALHSVGALVSIDPERADQALERLGDLLRYALDGGDTVMLAQEWRFTEDYLSFVQLRLEDRLRVDAFADPAAMAVMVPPLILQPLVENAVRHGIGDRPDGGHIRINASVDDASLVLRVQDDGGGGADGGAEGIGLTSVRRRLAALYGGRARLDIWRGSAGYEIVVTLPLEATAQIGSAA